MYLGKLEQEGFRLRREFKKNFDFFSGGGRICCGALRTFSLDEVKSAYIFCGILLLTDVRGFKVS